MLPLVNEKTTRDTVLVVPDFVKYYTATGLRNINIF
jgi:hypothetical protein